MEARCFVFFFFFFLEKFSIIADRFSIVFALLLEDVDIKEGWKIRDNMLQRKRYFLILDKKKMLRYLFEFNHSMTRNSIFFFFLPINRSPILLWILKTMNDVRKDKDKRILLARVAKREKLIVMIFPISSLAFVTSHFRATGTFPFFFFLSFNARRYLVKLLWKSATRLYKGIVTSETSCL